MTKIQMTKTKTNARETHGKHKRVRRRVLLLLFVLNFEFLDLEIVSGFDIRVSYFIFFSL